jgi:endo-1,4-beta-D-glucanase Y
MRFTTTRMLVVAVGVVTGAGGAAGCLDADPGLDPGDGDSASLSAAVTCGASGVANPFGNHAKPYAGGIKPSNHTQAQLDGVTASYYDAWKKKYVKQGCGTGRYYVKTFMSDSQTVSEAHGFGMVIVAIMAGHDPDAKKIFDGMHSYFKAHQSHTTPYLMAWSQDKSCKDNQGPDSATDGDLDVAYALLLADKQWGSSGAINYKSEALKVIAAIKAGETTASYFVNLGDWTGSTGTFGDATRTSDFMPGHFTSFAAATGDSTWTNIANHSYDMVATLQASYAPSTGLLPDFVKTPRTPKPAPANYLEGPDDGKYSWNACRDPMRITMHYLTTGDARAKTAAKKMSTWIKSKTGSNPDNIKAGYALSGTPLADSDYLTMAFAAPFAVSAMTDSSQTWVNDNWDSVAAMPSEGYYEDTIKMLSLIALSGNWWAPEHAPCP